MATEPEIYYLVIDGEKVAEGSEADMVNLAAQYDSDYELLTPEEWKKRCGKPSI